MKRRMVAALVLVAIVLVAGAAVASNLSGIDIWEWWGLWWLYVNGSDLWRLG